MCKEHNIRKGEEQNFFLSVIFLCKDEISAFLKKKIVSVTVKNRQERAVEKKPTINLSLQPLSIAH